jgi:hypothetical protein
MVPQCAAAAAAAAAVAAAARPDSLNLAAVLLAEHPHAPIPCLFQRMTPVTWRLAGIPTRRSPSLVKATIEGVVR